MASRGEALAGSQALDGGGEGRKLAGKHQDELNGADAGKAAAPKAGPCPAADHNRNCGSPGRAPRQRSGKAGILIRIQFKAELSTKRSPPIGVAKVSGGGHTGHGGRECCDK